MAREIELKLAVPAGAHDALVGWLDAHAQAFFYAERLERIYMDRLRLDVGNTFQFVPPALVLRRQQVLGPDGAPLHVYFRRGQRRVDAATDGEGQLRFTVAAQA